ncbi:MAG: hypothetical protein AAF771_07135 [Pseudomonadota bacterium]
MSGKHVTKTAAAQRAGVPLARAQRLAKATKSASFGTPWVYTAIGLLSAAGLAGYGVIAGSGATSRPAGTVTTAELANEQVPNSSGALASLSDGAARGFSDLASETGAAVPSPGLNTIANVDAREVDTGSSTAPSSQLAPPAEVVRVSTVFEPVTGPSCIAEVERNILGLSNLMDVDEPLEEQKGALAALVQSTLDCQDARLQIAGSLELFGSGLADLRVHWDRSGWNLDLAMVDSTFGPSGAQSMKADDALVEFVVR